MEQRWRQWRKHDPIHLVSTYKTNLKSLRGIYIDCGWRDQYHIHYGSRILSKRLSEAGIKHTYEEFDDDHFVFMATSQGTVKKTPLSALGVARNSSFSTKSSPNSRVV